MIVWLLLLLSPSAFGLEMVGEARDYSGNVLYVEKHSIQEDERGLSRKIESEYRKPGGETFAKMTADFSKSALLPDLVFEDSRFDLRDELRYDPAAQSVILRHAMKGKKAKEVRLKADSLMVATQAFDNFIKLNFRDLNKKRLPVHFVVLSNLDFFRFEALAADGGSADAPTFRLSVKSFFLKFFVDDIRVRYEALSKRLKFYQGVSNIRDDKGRTQKVKINYEFMETVKIR